MVIGAAAKLGEPRLDALLGGARLTPAAITGALGLLAMSFIPDAKEHLITYLVGGTAVGACTVLVLWKLRTWTVGPRGTGLLVKLGTISYAVYLWNYPISWWLRDAGAPEVPVTTIALSILAGTLSWLLVERPIATLKQRLDQKAPTPTALERERASV